MILDAIVSLFASIFLVIVEGLAAAFVPLVNLLAAGLEIIISLFISGFQLGRLHRREKDQQGNSPGSRASSSPSPLSGILALLLLLGTVSLLVIPWITHRKITLLAEDGHSLPFAALVIHTHDGDQHQRTDSAGNIRIPRFTTTAVTVKDPRYVPQTWQKSAIGSQLTVSRTVLGSSLDIVADRLLKPAKDKPSND
ncbi:hypothetical protein [Luteolibacter soli]|uniref:NfeD-like C-terminal domain-containing protein n=1 Tax=Luteolibacter soli TaxID=3135280 RepID=A0ABU9AW25_9BACT